MSADHPLPVPESLLARACDAICRTAGTLPFERDGILMTRELLAAAMEELNAEATRTLAISARISPRGMIIHDGLDRHLASRGFPEQEYACIADVLIESGIALRESVADKRSRHFVRAVRLAAPWTWTILGEDTGSAGCPVMGCLDDDAASWTSLCPVCRNGKLDLVSGEDLYGISRTDFFACRSCGAKFIPDGRKYRLIAIPKRRDPQWLEYLNVTCTPAEWRYLAKAGCLPEHVRPAGRPPGRRAGVNAGSGQAGQATIAADIGGRTFFFTRIAIRFLKREIRNCFAGRRETLRDILGLQEYSHLRTIPESRYRAYLDVPVGYFLSELRTRGDPLYRQFLHGYGDSVYGSFRAEKSAILSRPGVYVVAEGPEILAAGASVCTFQKTIDDLLGTVPPSACYLDGDPERCRINTLLCSGLNRGLYVHALPDEREVPRFLAMLTATTFPAPLNTEASP